MTALVVMAFDYGRRRIGLARGDTITRTAAPLATVPCHDGTPDWPSLDRALKSSGPDQLVVGAPYNDDGSPGRMAAEADAFAQALAARYGLPVARVDERYSSTSAQSMLREQRAQGVRRRAVRKGDVDSAAAAIMLASWLEQHHA